MGTKFLASSLVVLLSPCICAEQLLLPGLPRKISPPSGDETLELHGRDPKTQPRTLFEQRQLEERQQMIKPKQVEPPGPKDFMMEVSLVIPSITTTGSRKDYTTEMTSHFSFLFRLSRQPSLAEELQLFTGIRSAYFSGSGVFGDVAGRYSFNYIGPVVGLGWFSFPEEDPVKTYAGFVLAAGIAVQSRRATRDPADAEVANDLDSSRGLKLDGNGLWFEFGYMTIPDDEFGLHFYVGTQRGSGKQFNYFATGLTLWY